MALWDSDFTSFRRSLGLGDTYPQARTLFSGISGLGLNDLDTPDGYGSAYQIWLNSQMNSNPALARSMQRQLAPTATRYRAAAAVDPTLTFTKFLEALDQDGVQRLSSQLSNYERGDRPSAFQRGYRLLGG